MAYTTFGAIDVGSNEVSLKIFEVSKKNGIKELEHIRYAIELGSQAYTNRKISQLLVDELCKVLTGFVAKMKEYQTVEYVAYATSALREATNNLLILDQIKLRIGINIKILSNSEQRFLCYKAIALKESQFNHIIEKGTAIVDVGAGSLQISLFDKEALISTQNIKLGSLRIRDFLSVMENQTDNFKIVISEFIDNGIMTYKDMFLQNQKIKNIIAVGDQLKEIIRYLDLENNIESITREEFNSFYNHLFSLSIDEISKILNISKEQASLIFPTAMIYQKMFSETRAETMWLSKITLCDGIVAEFAEKKEKIIPSHDFSEDIIMAARNIAKRYHCNTQHTKNVEYIALKIFDSIHKYHGLGRRERLLLQIAITLHNCGEYINMNEEAQNSYKIVMSTEIIGLSHLERELIANLIKSNSDDFLNNSNTNDVFDKDTHITLTKLSAIFIIANAMDKSHKQKIIKLRIMTKNNVLIITIDSLKDTTLEKGLFQKKAEVFQEVYGIRPILK
jgi:exopolyphosphatase / guanosine-5'-triphosphate,3'-diphosphate pyrophosphatase